MALIYQIKCKTTQKSYVGSTKMTLEKRMYAHENLCGRWKEGRANFCSSYPLIETNNFESSILEHCTLEDKRERESHWIKITENCVNKNIPNRSMKQWYIDNKDRWRQHMKEYYHEVRKPKRLEAKNSQKGEEPFKLYCPKCHWRGDCLDKHVSMFIDTCPIAKRYKEEKEIETKKNIEGN